MIDPGWLLFIVNLPGRNQTLRMRIWRSLKAAGAGALRDGVYALPLSAGARALFERQQGDIEGGGGAVYLLEVPDPPAGPQRAALRTLFDRAADYQAIAAGLQALRRGLRKLEEPVARRRLAALSRDAAALAAVDFFPGPSRAQLEAALADADRALRAQFSPDEPHPARRPIRRLDAQEFRGRTWATRERLWIDRICSAWLIRRFIDPRAKFLWLKRPKDRPRGAVGFDFDGAEFTHVGTKVTFEVLIASFGLEADAGLHRLAALVHFLDVGGIPVAEAAGLAAIVTGARATQADDDALLRHVGPVLDSLHQAYSTAAD